MDPATGKRYLSGITLDQIDEINLLLSNLHAVGNVVCCAITPNTRWPRWR